MLPHRIADELGWRADLLGDRLPDYVSMLLSAAADRLVPPSPAVGAYRYAAPYGEQDLVDLDGWSP